MNEKVRIEVDQDTAATLEARAAELGVTVSELVAGLIRDDSPPAEDFGDQIAELERRWQKVLAGGGTVPHDKVVGWLETWGTPEFKPWQTP